MWLPYLPRLELIPNHLADRFPASTRTKATFANARANRMPLLIRIFHRVQSEQARHAQTYGHPPVTFCKWGSVLRILSKP